MHLFNITKNFFFFLIISIFLFGCNGKKFKLPGGDARKTPADPAKRIEQNLKEGRGFQLNDIGKSSGVFEFASSNGLWKASLDVIDFMPLSSVNYSGGIIVTDWYSDNNSLDESVKISIRFMTNELRSDALDIKIFNRKCVNNLLNCTITESQGEVSKELKKEILKKAAIYQQQDKDKKN